MKRSLFSALTLAAILTASSGAPLLLAQPDGDAPPPPPPPREDGSRREPAPAPGRDAPPPRGFDDEAPDHGGRGGPGRDGPPGSPGRGGPERGGAGGEGRPRGGPGRDGREPRLTDEQISDAIEIIREYRPERAQMIEEMRKNHPERVGEMLREHLPRLMELVYLKRNDPEMYKLRVDDFKLGRETFDLARQHRQATDAKDDAKAKETRAQLEAKLRDHFAVRQKLRESELARLEKQIGELRAKIEATKTSKDQLIQQRLEEMTGKGQRPEW